MTPSLVLIESRVEYTRNKKWKGKYLCVCGNTFIAIEADVRSGRTKSCGCYSEYVSKTAHTTHGMRYTVEYKTYIGMKKRCYNPNAAGYQNYGGRGIDISEKWLESFDNFFRDMGYKPSPAHSIDRIDNDRGYSKENCKWATRKEQSNNQRIRKDSVLLGGRKK